MLPKCSLSRSQTFCKMEINCSILLNKVIVPLLLI